jgi:hypothetical protein
VQLIARETMIEKKGAGIVPQHERHSPDVPEQAD